MSFSSSLSRSILRTIVFYDLFSYPLTAKEIHNTLQFTKKQIHSMDIMDALEHDPWLIRVCVKKNGYYCLRGSENSVNTRHDRYILAYKKFRRVRWFLYLLSLVPYIKLMCVCNSLSYSNSHPSSDIDLFIVTQKDTAHLARILAGSLAAFFGLRPKEDCHTNKICLSFFVDEDNMDIGNFRLGEDIYLYHWFLHLIPLYDQGDMFQKLLQKNEWVREQFSLFLPKEQYGRILKHGRVLQQIKKIVQHITTILFFTRLRKKLFAYEERRFPPSIKEIKNKDTRVVVQSGVLKFHPNDRREEYARRFQEKMSALERAYSQV